MSHVISLLPHHFSYRYSLGRSGHPEITPVSSLNTGITVLTDIIIETTISLHFFFPSLSCGTNQPKVSLLGQPVTITPAISKKGEASRPLQVKNERWECEGVASGQEDVNHGAEDLAQNFCP